MSAKNNKTLQQKIDELDRLTAWFDSEDFALEQAIEKFKEADALAKSIEHELNEMKNTITVVKRDFSGSN